MDFGFSESQQMLKTSARDFLSRECPHTLVRSMENDPLGYPPDLWRTIAGDLGWLGLALPEEYNGSGLDFVSLCVLLEEMGRALLPTPFFSTVVTGAMPILHFGTEAQKQGFLPKISAGELIMSFAQYEVSGRYDAEGIQLLAKSQGEGFSLEGTKLFVINGHIADYLIVPARTQSSSTPQDGITCFLIPAKSDGISTMPLDTIASDKQYEMVFDNVSVANNQILGKLNQGWKIIESISASAAIGQCALMLGGGDQVLEMTLAYVKDRVQFGRPIGSFQAIQHHCANMASDMEASRHITYHAAWRIAQGLEASREVAMAKSWVSEAYRRVCALGHQCHGAIGFTKEHNMQLYYRRAKAAELAFGSPDHHREQVAQMLGI
jgi:alkylation response protein AidB-like acyl-CoA dehydrogenase